MPNKTKGVIKDTAFYQRLGRLGGLKTKERTKDDPEYYERNGLKGGKAVVERYGIEHFSRIGQLPKKNIVEGKRL